MGPALTPFADIEVIGSKRRHKFEAIVDTGFSGFVCIPSSIGKTLGLELSAIEPIELGDGRTVKQYMFDGQVEFLDKTFRTSIMMSESETALIGTLLLGDCELEIDFPTQEISITRKDF